MTQDIVSDHELGAQFLLILIACSLVGTFYRYIQVNVNSFFLFSTTNVRSLQVNINFMFQYGINPIDPNPAISARVVFPQSGHFRPEKRPFFQKILHFSKREHTKKYPPAIGVQYIKLKPLKFPFKHRRNHPALINSYD